MSWQAVFVLTVLLLAGCGARTGLKDPPEERETTGGSSVPDECSSDMDCDDHVFCNGAERCVDGRCTDGDPVECPEGDECHMGYCDEARRSCVEVLIAADDDGDGHFAAPCGDDCDDHEPDVAPGVPEECNARDDDCDGMVDEDLERPCADGGTELCEDGTWLGCPTEPCLDPSPAATSPWQLHEGRGVLCFGRSFSGHGHSGEFDWASIPPSDDAGWDELPGTNTSFSRGSTLCDAACFCLDGGDFTYLQALVIVPEGYLVTSLRITISDVDDGARVTIFNGSFPAGVVDPGSYIQLGEPPITTDLVEYLVAGRNRLVITHVDDCCSESRIGAVEVVLDGEVLEPCD